LRGCGAAGGLDFLLALFFGVLAAAFAFTRFAARAVFFLCFFLRDAMAADAKESRTLRQDGKLCAPAKGC
jgi:hypothetical protein